MKNTVIYLITAAVCLLAWGCSKPHPEPPTEKLALTVRFFESIRSGDSAAAARQGRKLYALAPENEQILRLVTIQESNDAVGNAQKLIRLGRINEALPVVAAAIKQYPANRNLKAAFPKLTQLRNAEKLLVSMQNAKNSSAMRGARIAARAGLSQNLTPALRRHLSEYEKTERTLAKRERDNIFRAGKRSTADARTAAEADRKRADADKLFQQSALDKTAEGERARSAAGAVPCDVVVEPEKK